jgi:hypothetical protein
LIKRELGWQVDEIEGVPREINDHGEKIECFMQGTRDYIKYLKRGYSRVAQINAFHVRSGRMQPEEASRLNAEFDGRKPHSLEVFLEYVGLTEQEFNQIVGQMVIPPHQPDFTNIPKTAKAWDFEQWYREDNRSKP